MWTLQKKCKVSDKVIEYVDCEKRYHAKCSDLSVDELIMIENGSNDWYCTNCKTDCGLCSRAVLNGHKAVQCDGCELWIHNECSFISRDDYENVLTTRCTWICPKCDFFNFSDSFFDDQLNLMTPNRFDPLSKDRNVRLSSNSSKETNSSNKTLGGLKLISININSIRGKKLDLLVFLEVHQPHFVAIQKLTAQLQLRNCSLKHVSAMYSERTETFMVAE